MIDKFTGEHAFLSNFFVEPDGTTVEHEFQAEKTIDLEERVHVLMQPTPGKAKRAGQKVTLRDGWEHKRIDIMRGLVLRKFWDHSILALQLINTGDAALIEGNNWHDNFWGICNCDKCQSLTWINLNNLGIILMEVRDVIRSFD